MDAPVLLEASHLGKRYARSTGLALRYAVHDAMRALLVGGHRASSSGLRPGEFWALADCNLDLERGECLGIIGPNGAGKTTLLKMLAGEVVPSLGRVRVHGRMATMIEVGAGLSPLLTGRENIFAWAQRLGYSTREATGKIAAITEFSELERGLDTPIKRYSSGMMTRLGFALIVHFPADVVLLDEVLAMSDAGFRARCLSQIPQLAQRCAMVFVSHQMAQIARVCNRAITLDAGRAVYQGQSIPEAIEAYYAACDLQIPSIASGNGAVRLETVEFCVNGRASGRIDSGGVLGVRFALAIQPDVAEPVVSLTLNAPDLTTVVQCDSTFSAFSVPTDGTTHVMEVDFGALPLNPGNYFLSLTVSDGISGQLVLRHDNAVRLRVGGACVGHAPLVLPGAWRIAAP